MPTSIDEEAILDGFSVVDANQQQLTLFDFEAIQNDGDKELWLIRVPEKVPKHGLASMQIKLSKKPGKALSRLYVDDDDLYTLYRVPKGKALEDDVGVSGHEMLEFSCLVPCRDKKCKMMFAPKEITNCFILNEEVVIPDNIQMANRRRQHPTSSIDSLAIPRKRSKDDEPPIDKKRKMTNNERMTTRTMK